MTDYDTDTIPGGTVEWKTIWVDADNLLRFQFGVATGWDDEHGGWIRTAGFRMDESLMTGHQREQITLALHEDGVHSTDCHICRIQAGMALGYLRPAITVMEEAT